MYATHVSQVKNCEIRWQTVSVKSIGKSVGFLAILHDQLGRVKRIWYLLPMRAVKVQASLRICASAQSRQNLRCSLIQAVSQEEPSDRKPDPWPLWMAGHAQLKFFMTECSKIQIRLTGLNWWMGRVKLMEQSAGKHLTRGT